MQGHEGRLDLAQIALTVVANRSSDAHEGDPGDIAGNVRNFDTTLGERVFEAFLEARLMDRDPAVTKRSNAVDTILDESNSVS